MRSGTRRELLKELTAVCEPIYGAQEASVIARMVLSERGGVSRAALIADPEAQMEVSDFEQICKELSEHRPVQYILGHCEFCDLDFRVCEGCLIPRPETEELVYNIRRHNGSARRILDIGTGSGCIAIALKKLLPGAEVTALDYSPEALEIARENATRLGADIAFVEGDALDLERFVTGPCDVIVSNPPYIPQSEQKEMRRNVTDHEPHSALFVPDNDPLLFYRSIGRSARNLLSERGSLWFEVHEHYADQTAEMLRHIGYARVEILLDLNDKKRMVWSRL